MPIHNANPQFRWQPRPARISCFQTFPQSPSPRSRTMLERVAFPRAPVTRYDLVMTHVRDAQNRFPLLHNMLKVPEYAATVHDIAAEQGREALSRGGTIATLKGDALEAAPSAHVTFPDKGARLGPRGRSGPCALRHGAAGRRDQPRLRHRRHGPCGRGAVSAQGRLTGALTRDRAPQPPRPAARSRVRPPVSALRQNGLARAILASATPAPCRHQRRSAPRRFLPSRWRDQATPL